MASPRFLALLLVTALLTLSFSRGVVVEGRKVRVMRAVRHYARWPRSPLHGALLQEQQDAAAVRMVSTVTDYSEPKPNTNPHSGVIPSPDPTSPPAH